MAKTPTYDTLQASEPGAGASGSFSITVGDHPFRCLFATVRIEWGTSGGEDLSYLRCGVNDSAHNFTQICNVRNTQSQVYWGYFLSPAVGANTIYWGKSAGSYPIILQVGSYYNVLQSTPYSGLQTSSSQANSSSITVTSETGDLVLAAIHHGPTIALTTGIGETSGQTLRASGSGAEDDYAEKAGAASTVMSWDHGSFSWHALAGFNVEGALAGASRVVVLAARWKSFLDDLRAGLVSPELLRRRYADMVMI